MNRWVWATTGAAAVAVAGPAAGQTPPPAGGDVMTIRTAGQPDRRVRVLKVERQPDGSVLTDVKDLATGLTYTMIDTKGARPAADSAVASPQAPMTVQSPQSAASPRPPSPLPPTGYVPPTPKPPAADSTPRPLFGAPFRSNATPTPPPQAGTPRAAQRSQDPLLTPGLVGNERVNGWRGERVTNPELAVPSAPPPAPRPEVPTVMGKLFGRKDAAPAPPPARVMPTVPTAPPDRPAAAPVKAPAPPPPDVRAAAPATRPKPAAAPTARPPAQQAVASPMQVQPPAPAVADPAEVSVVSAVEQMRSEIAQPISDLRSHVRPSFRMESATALAEGRYGSQDEVKAALAQSARTDPAPVVRGHCVRLLSRLGYADPGYVADLRRWAADPEPAVRRAAADALARVGG